MKHILYKQLISIILSISLVYASITFSLAQHRFLAVPGVREVSFYGGTQREKDFITVPAPLVPEYLRGIDFKKEIIEDQRRVAFMIKHLKLAMEQGGFGHAIGVGRGATEVTPDNFKLDKCRRFEFERIKIICFKVKKEEKYVFSISAGEEIIGHGKVSAFPTRPDAVSFRYSIHGGEHVESVMGINFRGKGYGKEALILMMAMCAKGELFGYTINDFFSFLLNREYKEKKTPGDVKAMDNMLIKMGYSVGRGEDLLIFHFSMTEPEFDLDMLTKLKLCDAMILETYWRWQQTREMAAASRRIMEGVLPYWAYSAEHVQNLKTARDILKTGLRGNAIALPKRVFAQEAVEILTKHEKAKDQTALKDELKDLLLKIASYKGSERTTEPEHINSRREIPRSQ